TGETQRRQADQPEAGAAHLFQLTGEYVLHVVARRIAALVEAAAMQQRPADRLAVADLLRLVRQARGAQQILEQDVGRIAALEGFARGQLHQQEHVAGPQQLQGEAWWRLDRLLLLRRNLRGRDRLGLLRLGHDDAQLRFFRANR